MYWMIFLSCTIVGTLLFAGLAIHAASVRSLRDTAKGAATAIAMVFFAVMVFFAAPHALGYGHVSSSAEEYSAHLDGGATYQVISATNVGDNTYVILVKKYGTSDFRAVRVNGAPPELFVMIDGKPIAVVK